jgi:hypothetical protein
MTNWDNFTGLIKFEILKDGPRVRYLWGIKIEYIYFLKKIKISFKKTKINLMLIEDLLSLMLYDEHIWEEDIHEVVINKKSFSRYKIYENKKIKNDIFEEKNVIEINYEKEICLTYEMACIIFPTWKNKHEDYSMLIELEKW